MSEEYVNTPGIDQEDCFEQTESAMPEAAYQNAAEEAAYQEAHDDLTRQIEALKNETEDLYPRLGRAAFEAAEKNDQLAAALGEPLQLVRQKTSAMALLQDRLNLLEEKRQRALEDAAEAARRAEELLRARQERDRMEQQARQAAEDAQRLADEAKQRAEELQAMLQDNAQKQQEEEAQAQAAALAAQQTMLLDYTPGKVSSVQDAQAVALTGFSDAPLPDSEDAVSPDAASGLSAPPSAAATDDLAVSTMDLPVAAPVDIAAEMSEESQDFDDGKDCEHAREDDFLTPESSFWNDDECVSAEEADLLADLSVDEDQNESWSAAAISEESHTADLTEDVLGEEESAAEQASESESVDDSDEDLPTCKIPLAPTVAIPVAAAVDGIHGAANEAQTVQGLAPLCSKCGNKLSPIDRFCMNCGQPVEQSQQPVQVAVAPAQTVCANCGTSLAGADRFCMNCGYPAASSASEAPASSLCPNCGAQHEAGDKFCMLCGQSL